LELHKEVFNHLIVTELLSVPLASAKVVKINGDFPTDGDTGDKKCIPWQLKKWSLPHIKQQVTISGHKNFVIRK
jgi:hypothetical protein